MQPFWAQLSLADRARYMRRAADVLLDEIDELAELLTREQGKPRVESYTMELLPTVDALQVDRRRRARTSSPTSGCRCRRPSCKTKRSKFVYEPLGVVGVIAPWNYPWSIPFGEVAIALMAGNGVVLKPASLTPLIGERIRMLFEKAGFPEGLVRTVHGGGRIGDALVKSTGAEDLLHRLRRGRLQGRRRVPRKRMKGSVLELGGKDPQIVCADADLANAVSGAVWGGFANAGQTCSGIERVYVHRDVADRVPRRASCARPSGSPSATRSTGHTEIGPMVSDEQAADRRPSWSTTPSSTARPSVTGGPTKVEGAEGQLHRPDRADRASRTRCGS